MDGCAAPPGSAAEGMEGRNIDIDFGRVQIFRERTRLVTFMRPMTQEFISYSITCNPHIGRVRLNFGLDHHQGVLAPAQDFHLLVTYKPIMRSERDLEVFDYTDSDGEHIKITVRGVAEGPRCMLSVNRLQFGGRGERKVELRNDSPASAHFQIHHPEGDVFQVRPLEGVVAPHGYTFLSVHFCPPREGVFVRKIFCLVWNCEPLILNLAGGGSSHAPIDELCGFSAYFEEGAVTVEPSSFDAGFAPTPSTLLAKISNRSTKNVVVDWRQQPIWAPVVVAPPTVEVPPLGSQEIKLQLPATAPYCLLHKTLLGQVDAASCLSLYVQAHSFPANQEWICHVQLLPEIVYWPPCAPGDVASTTFLMRNRSHLPVQFRLESPKATKVKVKPRMGVFRHWQIVAVRLQTEQGAAKTYMEAWQVVVNGRALPLYFHGLTCVPCVEIGRGNRIDAGPIQDGSQKEVEVPMKNSSLCPVDFHFQLGKMVTVSPMTGRLPPNETLTLLVKVTGSQCAPSTERFHCLLRIVDASGAVTGHGYDLPVDIVAECSYSQLCACPSSEDFGRVPFGHRLKCQFDASNFGNTAIYFQACQSGEDTTVHIRPSFGEVQPRRSQRFIVGGVASIVGGATLSFGYYNRLVKDSPLVTGSPTTLFTLSYQAEFPIVQIEGVVEHNFGGLFAKGDLYGAYLGVAALNHALRHVANDQTLEHRSRLPELPVDLEQEFWVRLTLGNVSDFDTGVSFKRLKLCDCTMQEVSGGLSKRGRGFQCQHRPALSVTPVELCLPAGATKIVNIVVKYCLPGATPLGFALQLSNNRTVLWQFEVYGVDPDKPRLSTYTPTFSMELAPVSLGDHLPPLQCFWLYNSNRRAISWQVDSSAPEWLLVINPVDEIQSQTRKPLLVKFQPVEPQMYSVELALSYGFADGPEGALITELQLHGRGLGEKLGPPKPLATPCASRLGSTFPASISADWLTPPLLPTWSSHAQLIFLKNTARNQVVQYTWRDVRIEGALEVCAEPTSGLLLPKEIHPVLVRVRTLATPCMATVLLPCQLVQYSDALMHQLTAKRHQEAQHRIDEFMVDEPSGAKRPVNPIRVVPDPPVLFASLAVDVASMHPKDFARRPWDEQALHPPEPALSEGWPPVAPTLIEAAVYGRVLEAGLAQVMFGQKMRSLLVGAVRAPHCFYSQFTATNQAQRGREIGRFFHQLSPTAIGRLLRRLIYQGLCAARCPVPQPTPPNLQQSIVGARYSCRNQQCSCRPPETHSA